MSSLKSKRILLVSSQTSQRSGIRKTLCDLGAENSQIEIAADFNQAREKLKSQQFHILITDDEIGPKEKGIDLLPLHEKNMPSSRLRTFVMLTSHSTPFVIADFILKGGDVIIGRPFTKDAFIKAIDKALKAKDNIGHDEGLLLDVQDALNVGDIQLARSSLEKFQNAEGIHAIHARALIAEVEGDMLAAFEDLLQVVSQKIHFRALVGLVRTGATCKRYSELLRFVELWLQEYPIHHASLPDMTRVIIVNSEYKLLDRLYKVFTQHKIEEHFAKVPLAAGFVMASSHHLESGQKDKALAYALKGIDYSCGKFQILSRALEILVKAGHREEAEKAYHRAPFEKNDDKDKVADLKLKEIIFPRSKILKECLKLLSEKVIDADLYDLTIKCMRDAGKDPDDMIYEARRYFPQRSFN